jgi:hypothetical protein
MAQFLPPESSVDEGPPPRRAKRRRRWILRTLAIVVALAAVTTAAAGIYVESLSKNFTLNIQRQQLLPSHPSGSPAPGTETKQSGTTCSWARTAAMQRTPVPAGATA